MIKNPAIWFPTVRCHSGSDKFTESLVEGLNKQGIQAEITWLPHQAEYLPWFIKKPLPPKWANIIHINTWLHPRFYPKEMPIVATLHHCVQDPLFSKYKTQAQKIYHNYWITPIERCNLKNATTITTVSQYTAKCAKEAFNIKNINVIYNGIDTNIFFPNNSIINSNKDLNFKLLFVGNSSVRKGFDLLPKIMEKLGDPYQLFYTSDAENYHPLPQNMIQLEHQKTAEDLASIYREMDALLFPSRLEGFGLVVAEAMACGLPPIIANSSALPELVTQNQSGMICEKDNIDNFVESIKRLKENQILQEYISINASQTIQNQFNFKDMIRSYIKIYQSII